MPLVLCIAKIKVMSAIQQLEMYIRQHPYYWEYENELQEVERLKALCSVEVEELV